MGRKLTEHPSKRARLGRPKLPPEKVRSNRVVTFVTDLELATLERGADDLDMTLSGFVHTLLLQGLDARLNEEPVTEEETE
jgi:hypothetical protein